MDLTPGNGMRVFIDAHNVGVRHGGNEQYFESIISNLAGLPSIDIRYFTFNYQGRGASLLSSPEVEVIKLKSRRAAIQRGIEIPFLCRKHEADILHVPFNFLPTGTCKKIVSIHDLSFLHVRETFSRGERWRMKALTGLCARRADHILTISEFSRNDIIETYGISGDKVTVAYCGVDGSVFRPWDEQKKQHFREEHGLDFRFFLFVGTLQPRKNVLFMLRCFVAYSELQPDIKLVLIGRKGWMYSEVFSFIKESGIEDKIIHRDDVESGDLPGYYNTADAFIMPSVFEGFGLPLIEAMRCGCPVLSSNSTCLPEVGGDAALYFDPHQSGELVDAMKTINNDNMLRNDIITRGFTNAARFSWQKSAEIIRQVYLEA